MASSGPFAGGPRRGTAFPGGDSAADHRAEARCHDTCYYDGQCGLCRRSTRLLRRLDWLGRLEFQDMTQAPDLPVPMETALQGMPMRTRDGRVLVGFPAVRRALFQTPLGLVPAALLYLPGLSHIGAACYRRIARNRARDCQLPPAPPPHPRTAA